MKQILYILIFSFFIHLQTYAQRKVPEDLARSIQGMTKPDNIMAVVHRYYDSGRANISTGPGVEEFESNEYHWWLKWEYWAKRRLKSDGTIADYKGLNYLAKQEIDNKYGAELKQAAENFKKLPPRDDFSLSTRGGQGSEPANLSYGGWTSIGPTTGGTVVGSGGNIDINGLGRMDRIAFHPTNANIFYVGSPSGSIYKTTNGGTSWTDVGEGLPGGVSCIEVSRVNGNILYAFSGDGDSHSAGFLVFNTGNSPISQGVFRSTDAGASWTKVTDMYTGSGDLIGYNMAIAENSSNILFAATNRGLYRTTDGGNSWTQVRSGLHYDVEIAPYNDHIIYACNNSSSSVYYSTNSGDTWSTSSFDNSFSANRVDLGVRQNNINSASAYVFVVAGDAGSGSFDGVFRSTNFGVDFTRMANTPNILGTTTNGSDNNDLGRYGLAICVKPSSNNVLATASLCSWRSTNSGTTWSYASTFREGLGPLDKYIHPDVHDVRFNPVDENLYACTDGGVYKSTDDGATWTDLSDGLAATQFYHMAMQDADGDGEMDGINLLGGAQDNGVKYRTTGGAYRHIICCDGYGVGINGNDADWLVMNINSSLYQTPNGGATMNFRGSVSFFSPVAVDHDNGDTMYVGSSTLLRSYDGFVSNTSIAANVNNFITTCPSNNARLYGSGSSNTNLMISEDRGTSWSTISGNTGWPTGSPTVTDCKPWATFSSEIYVTFAGYTDGVKVFRSSNAGDSWTNISGSLPNVPIHSCAVASEGVYVGTEIGVFFRPDGGSDWTPFFNGMPRVIVSDLWVNGNGLVYASTFGRGAWFSNRYTTCPATVTVAGNLQGPRYYEASSTANVSATANAGAGNDIFVKSNGYVDLLDGFEITAGTFFEAYLGPCSNGVPTTDFARSPDEPIHNIIEYDDKGIAANKKQAASYYALARDGIEINLADDVTVDVEIVNTETKEVKKLVSKTSFTKGMYKILTGKGVFAVKVLVNGAALSKLGN